MPFPLYHVAMLLGFAMAAFRLFGALQKTAVTSEDVFGVFSHGVRGWQRRGEGGGEGLPFWWGFWRRAWGLAAFGH